MIETARLILRSWRAEDRAPFAAMSACPIVMACLGGPLSEEQVDAAIARAHASEAANGYCFWAMERKSDGAFFGRCGLQVTRETHVPIAGEIEIGWRLRQDMWGQGYAREAALATLRWAWARGDIDRVIAMTVPTNRRSWGLMERIGMTRRPALDFGHSEIPENHPLYRHLVYAVERPGGVAMSL